MAKAATETETAPESAPTPDDFELSLEEFCAQLSQTDRRVELIGGFFSTEKQAGRAKDRFAAFQSRFRAFANKPA